MDLLLTLLFCLIAMPAALMFFDYLEKRKSQEETLD